jgi:hypothetical protein
MYISQLKTLLNPPFSDDLRHACRTRLLGCLGDLNSQTTVVRSGEKAIKVPAVATDGELWVSKVLATIQALERDRKHVSLLSNPDENDVALRTQALDIATRLKLVSELCMRGGCEIKCCHRFHKNQQGARSSCCWRLSCSNIARNQRKSILIP